MARPSLTSALPLSLLSAAVGLSAPLAPIAAACAHHGQRWGQFLLQTFAPSTLPLQGEPRITGPGPGDRRWTVSDPRHAQTHTFHDDHAVRIWLEQRYNAGPSR